MTPSTSKHRDLRAYFQRYDALLTNLLTPSANSAPFQPATEDADRLQVERGLLFPRFLLEPAAASLPNPAAERLIAVASPLTLERLTIVDRAGHQRLVYRPLLLYAWLQAFRIGYELLPRSEFGRWEEAARAWCDDLEYRLGEIAWPADDAPAAHGDQFAEACWTALALHVAGKVFIRDAWTDLAADVFGKLARRQRASGAFLSTTASDNPETHWFHELTILHAAASYAVQNEDRPLAAAVAKATNFHLNETQPDHATNQPWALFAFLWNPDTQPTADGMLNTLETNRKDSRLRTEGLRTEDSGLRTEGNTNAFTQSSVLSPQSSPPPPQSSVLPDLTLMLLADALYCVRLFETP